MRIGVLLLVLAAAPAGASTSRAPAPVRLTVVPLTGGRASARLPKWLAGGPVGLALISLPSMPGMSRLGFAPNDLAVTPSGLGAQDGLAASNGSALGFLPQPLPIGAGAFKAYRPGPGADRSVLAGQLRRVEAHSVFVGQPLAELGSLDPRADTAASEAGSRVWDAFVGQENGRRRREAPRAAGGGSPVVFAAPLVPDGHAVRLAIAASASASPAKAVPAPAPLAQIRLLDEPGASGVAPVRLVLLTVAGQTLLLSYAAVPAAGSGTAAAAAATAAAWAGLAETEPEGAVQASAPFLSAFFTPIPADGAGAPPLGEASAPALTSADDAGAPSDGLLAVAEAGDERGQAESQAFRARHPRPGSRTTAWQPPPMQAAAFLPEGPVETAFVWALLPMAVLALAAWRENN